MENRNATCGHGTGEAAPAASCGHHISDTATALLSEEHRIIERLLVVIEKLTTLPLSESRDSWKTTLDVIRGFADGCHHFKEERVLFPALEEHGVPVEGGPVGMMLMEHDEGREYVRSMAAALNNPDTESTRATLVENARSYIRLLREHIQKEDDVLFRIAEDTLTASEQKDLLRAFEEHETTEMGAGVHEKYLKIVDDLEKRVR
jgi:hemerythrin-like domain-containing protein